MKRDAFVHSQLDERIKCYSHMSVLSVGDYLRIIRRSYDERGSIRHQRGELTTTSGRRIRQRLVSDIQNGAVLPPIVVGIISTEENQEKQIDHILNITAGDAEANISIIDGMQRTTALIEAVSDDSSVNMRVIRVEWWVSRSTESLIYRMLVLNTGQSPWNLQKQLQVVFDALIQEINERVDFTRLLRVRDDNDRRTSAGEFSASDLVECYMAFGLRKTEFDTKEQLADEFSRLDVAEAIQSNKYNAYFYPIIQMMVNLDIAFSRFDAEIDGTEAQRDQIFKGRHIFDAQAARIGFVVAASIAVLGRVAMNRSQSDSDREILSLSKNIDAFIDRLNRFTREQHIDFMKLDVLSQMRSGLRQAAVGRQQRAMFERAFQILFENAAELPSLETCWRS